MQFQLWPLRTLFGDIQFDLFPASAAMQQHTGSMSAGQHEREKPAAPWTLKPFLICLHFTTNLQILQQFSFFCCVWPVSFPLPVSLFLPEQSALPQHSFLLLSFWQAFFLSLQWYFLLFFPFFLSLAYLPQFFFLQP